MPRLLPTLTTLLMFAISFCAHAEIISLNPSKDNTLIQATDPAAQRSNGQGDVFTGRTNQDGQGPATVSIRRGLVQFDIARLVPAGSVITNVSLTMRDVMGLNGDPVVALHRVLQNWGEGASFQNGGQGDLAKKDDATWLYTFFNDTNPTASPAWTNPGGDFSDLVSGQVVISDDLGGGQTFTWASNSQMVADVQRWLDNPGSNFGWILIGDESRGQSAKRLTGGESATPPILAITYVAIPETPTLALAGSGMVALTFIRLVVRRRQTNGTA